MTTAPPHEIGHTLSPVCRWGETQRGTARLMLACSSETALLAVAKATDYIEKRDILSYITLFYETVSHLTFFLS
jgi:hypothetical protein